MEGISDLLLISVCHADPGTLSDDDINEVEELISIFSALWRKSSLSVTIKVHIIETHLITYLRRFRGLGSYEESFIKKAHQEGVKMERRSANIKHIGTKATMHSCWERLGSNPAVEERVRNYNNKRKKRKINDVRVVNAKYQRNEKQRIKVENRQKAKNNNVELLVERGGQR